MDVAFLLAARLGVEPFSPSSAADRGTAPGDPPPSPSGTAEAVDAVTRAQRTGHPERAWPLLRELEPRLPFLQDTDPEGAGRVLGALATQALIEGDPEAFLARSRSAAEAYDRAAATVAAYTERAALGAAYRMFGAWEEAAAALRAAIDAADRLRIAQREPRRPPDGVAARAQFDFARVLVATADEADDVDAGANLGSALQDLEWRGDRGWVGVVKAWDAMYAATMEGRRASVQRAREAEELLGGSAAGRVYAAAALAAAQLSHGNVGKALAAAEKARRGQEALGRLDEGDVLLLLTVGDARKTAGDKAGAAAAYGDARQRVLADAGRIRDPALRRSFLEDVPEHRRALRPSG